MTKLLFKGQLAGGAWLDFYEDKTWIETDDGNVTEQGEWDVDDSTLLIVCHFDPLSPAVIELQDAYDEWQARLGREVASIIVT